MSSSHNRWTDEEIGFLQEHQDWSPLRLAQHLDRTPHNISVMRHRLKKGWTPKETNIPWTEDEDSIIEDHPYLTNSQRASLLPGRSADAVRQRRAQLGLGADERNKDPHKIANRPLIAKTCPKCGLLLDSRWFKRVRGGCWNSRCGKCSQAVRPTTGRAKSSTSDMAAWYQAAQRLTSERATRSGYEWTSADMEVLSDARLTVVEKALQLGRTYAATSTQCAARGFTSRHPDHLGDVFAQQWLIFAPHAEDMIWEMA